MRGDRGCPMWSDPIGVARELLVLNLGGIVGEEEEEEYIISYFSGVGKRKASTRFFFGGGCL